MSEMYPPQGCDCFFCRPAPERRECSDCGAKLPNWGQYACSCCNVERCRPCEEEHYEEQEEEDDDVPDYREWFRPPASAADQVDGDYIRASRTVGVEFELDSGRDNTEGLPPEVGYTLHGDADIEARTPPATGLTADRLTRNTLTQLLANGYYANEGAGLHVHVDFSDGSRSYTRAEKVARSRWLALWAVVEPIAYLFDPDREHSSWSYSWFRNDRYYTDTVTPEALVRRATRAAMTGQGVRFTPDHYTSANFNGGFDTIEFRGHNSCNDVEHVMAWVAFLQGMVDLSQKMGLSAPRRLLAISDTRERAEALLRLAKHHGVLTGRATAGIRQVVAPAAVPQAERVLVAA